MSRQPADNLWSLAFRPGQIDEQELWEALRHESRDDPTDYRSGLLVHESLSTLAQRWGEVALDRRLDALGERGARLRRVWRSAFDEVGFPSLERRVVNATSRESILQMLRELGRRLRRPAQITVGGSSSLLLADLIVRRTADIDVVDELPEAIRAEPALVDELAARYELRLAHFASHYLPSSWKWRVSSLEPMGRLNVFVLDPLDVLCGKVFSKRSKDLDDLRAAWPNVDRDAFRERVRRDTAALRSDPALAEAAEHNWYVLTGEEGLP